MINRMNCSSLPVFNDFEINYESAKADQLSFSKAWNKK
jgi:hypothetical protein